MEDFLEDLRKIPLKTYGRSCSWTGILKVYERYHRSVTMNFTEDLREIVQHFIGNFDKWEICLKDVQEILL